MEFIVGKKYTHIVRNYDRAEHRKKRLNQEQNLYTCDAIILDPPKTTNTYIHKGTQVYARLIDRRNGRTQDRWVKKDKLILEK